MTSLSEADLYVTIPMFSILDIRPDTKPEMRLMLGSCTDVHKQMSPDVHVELPTSTMFLMDCRWRMSSKSFVVRIQQPRILVVPDFLLAVCEYFVPSLGTITGREEMMDPKNDPIVKNSSIVLSAPFYKQTEDIVHLSPSRQLVADAVGIDEYTYDGCGKTIRLTNEEVKEFHSSEAKYIIIVGRGKRLRFVNVKFEVLLFPHLFDLITYSTLLMIFLLCIVKVVKCLLCGLLFVKVWISTMLFASCITFHKLINSSSSFAQLNLNLRSNFSNLKINLQQDVNFKHTNLNKINL